MNWYSNIKIIYIPILLISSKITIAAMINIYSLDIERSEYISNIFIEKYKIPKQLIKKIRNDCEVKKVDKRMLNLCINKKGELKLLSSNIDLIIKSLSAFNKPY